MKTIFRLETISFTIEHKEECEIFPQGKSKKKNNNYIYYIF